LDGMRVLRAPEEAEAHREREEIAHCDGALRGNGVVERPVDTRENATIRELGQEPIDGLVEAELGLVDKDERRRGGARFRHRRDTKDRVATHREASERRLAEDVDVDFTAPTDDGDQARQRAAGDVASHEIVNRHARRVARGEFAHKVAWYLL